LYKVLVIFSQLFHPPVVCYFKFTVSKGLQQSDDWMGYV